MFEFSLKITGPDLRPRAAKKALRSAEDTALLEHRRKNMPKHFTGQAKYRYPKEYSKVGTRYIGLQQRKSDPRKRPNAYRAARPGVKKPLVDTGLLQQKMLYGGVIFSGRYDKRKMKYSPPYYASISAYGQINKKAALEAVNAQEEERVAQAVDKEFHKNLEKNQVTKTGG